MGFETRRNVGARPKKTPPPYFSHEFVITNHGDIVSCVLMILVGGLFIPFTYPFSHLLIFPQYNETVQQQSGEQPSQTYHGSGVRDLGAFFFYTLVWITVHCIIQEYIVDKVHRRLHMSRSRLTRFSESAHLAPVSAILGAVAVYFLVELNVFTNFRQLYHGYPDTHRYMSTYFKLFFLGQISYWLHQFPEFYFQKLKTDEMKERTYYSLPFLCFVTIAYFTNFTRVATALVALEYLSLAVLHTVRLLYFSGNTAYKTTMFRLWNGVFLSVRMASIVVLVLTFWYGLRSLETPFINFETGNFNTRVVRLNALLVLIVVQLFLIHKFLRFQFHRWNSRKRSSGESEPVRRKSKAKKEEKKQK